MDFSRQRVRIRTIALMPLFWLAIAAAALDNGLLPDAKLIERIRREHSPAAAERIAQWGELMRQLPALDEGERLRRVNAYFNRIPGVTDAALWGEPDYWATPLEFLVRNGGDCEDYALAKYFTLKMVGIPAEKLRISYVRAWLPRERRMEAHMVLSYFPDTDSDPLILDNLVAEIRPAPERTDLTPTHHFNAEGLWSARQRGQNGRLGDATRIGRWVDLLAKMNEGK